MLLLIATVTIFLLLGHVPGVKILWLPVLTLLALALGMGTGLVLGILNVFLRDVGQIVPIALQFLYWFTPVVYMAHIIPEHYRQWLVFNPMYAIVEAYHNILVFNQPPALLGLVLVSLLTVLLLALAFKLFRKASPEMVDML